MAERLKAAVLKTVVASCVTVGSNPTLSVFFIKGILCGIICAVIVFFFFASFSAATSVKIRI